MKILSQFGPREAQKHYFSECIKAIWVLKNVLDSQQYLQHTALRTGLFRQQYLQHTALRTGLFLVWFQLTPRNFEIATDKSNWHERTSVKTT